MRAQDSVDPIRRGVATLTWPTKLTNELESNWEKKMQQKVKQKMKLRRPVFFLQKNCRIFECKNALPKILLFNPFFLISKKFNEKKKIKNRLENQQPFHSPPPPTKKSLASLVNEQKYFFKKDILIKFKTFHLAEARVFDSEILRPRHMPRWIHKKSMHVRISFARNFKFFKLSEA